MEYIDTTCHAIWQYLTSCSHTQASIRMSRVQCVRAILVRASMYMHADAAKVEVLSPGSQVPRCTPIAKSSPLWELHSECILHPAPRFGLIHRKTRRFPDISLQNPERSVKFFYAIYYEYICVFCKEINIQRCFFIENCVIVIFIPRNYSSQMLFFLTTWIYLSIVFLMEKKIFIKERKMFGIYANFSFGTQKIFSGALTHYMSYYYFKGYMYTCIEWHVGVSVLSPATQVSRYSRYVTNITHEYFMDLIAEIF